MMTTLDFIVEMTKAVAWPLAVVSVAIVFKRSLPNLIELKYHSMTDAAEALGGVDEIRNLFFNFQQHLYERQEEIKQPG